MSMAAPAAHETLALPNPTPHNHLQLVDTVISELLPEQSSRSLQRSLALLGYTGDPNSRQQLIPFLLSSLQAHRILQHKQTKAPPASPSDVAVTTFVSRIAANLSIPAPTEEGNSNNDARKQLLSLMRRINHSLSKNKEVAVEAMGPSLCPDMSDSTVERCKKVFIALHQRHTTATSMLIERLKGTADSFSRSYRAHPLRFAPLTDKYDVMLRDANTISPYQVFTARYYVQRFRKRARPELPSRVKAFVMTQQLPDRGGRIGPRGQPNYGDRELTADELREERARRKEEKFGKGWKGGKAYRKRKHNKRY